MSQADLRSASPDWSSAPGQLAVARRERSSSDVPEISAASLVERLQQGCPQPDGYLVVAPYLSLPTPVQFGPWWLGPIADYNGKWPSSQICDHALSAAASMCDDRGTPLSNVCLLASRDGRRPILDSGAASNLGGVKLALQLGVVHAILRGRVDGFAGSSDSAELMAWPVYSDKHHHRRYHCPLRTIDNAHQVGLDGRFWAPFGLGASSVELNETVFDAAVRIFEFPGGIHTRLREATRCLANASRDKDRMVAEGVRSVDLAGWSVRGFETLLGGLDGPRRGPSALVQIYERLAVAGATTADCGHLLWSPAPADRAAMKRWLRVFVRAWRDELRCPQGSVEPQCVDHPSYPAKAHTWTAVRLLCETILVSMSDLGWPDLWRL